MKDNTNNNLYMNIANDLILDYARTRSIHNPLKYEYVYKLICRPDSKRPNTWNAIPEIERVVFTRDSAAIDMYIDGIKEVYQYHLITNPYMQEILFNYKDYIEKFKEQMNKIRSYNARIK